MDCPSCGEHTRVLESRRAEDGAAVRRRRECPSCGRRLTSFERAEPETLFVRKRNGDRRPFDRQKLRTSLARAAHKRPVGAAQLETLVDRIAARIRAENGELESSRIAELCLEGLRELDAGAYLQFAGVDLADPEAIRDELEHLQQGPASNRGENPANRGVEGGGFRPVGVGSSVVTPKHPREENI
jgi:transcriptional repressor NrdR